MSIIVNSPYAVIIANGESCSSDLLNESLSGAELVIVLDGAMHRFVELNYKADVLLGDFDKNDHSHEFLKTKYPNLKIVHIPEQDSTDFEKGVLYAEKVGYTTIIVLWATGKRADHSFTNMANLIRFNSNLDIKMIDDYSTIYRLSKEFEKYYEKGNLISLIPIGEVKGITTQNLKYNLSNESLELGKRNGNSNEAESNGVVKISYTKGELLMMECHD